MSPNSPAWYLTISKGPKAGSAYPLPAATLTIGRQAGNQIVIDDPMVSRRHARLTWQGTTFLLEDLGSANGTWVNNARITGPTLLRAGDVIGLSQEILLVFSNQPGADETVYRAPRPAPVPAVVPPAPLVAPPPTRADRGWLAFGIGGLMTLLGIVALVVVGVAVYLFTRNPSSQQAALPASVTATSTTIPTATPYPTYTPVPTEAPTHTPYPTYTPYPTPVPTATPYPTYTPFPTAVPTATPYPTYTPYPTATPRPRPVEPTSTPVPPTAASLPPYTVILGRNVSYEPWGRPADPGGCKGPYDDRSPVRRFTVEVILTNNSNRYIPDAWYPTFYSAKGRSLPACIWYYNNTAVQPGESTDVTFATHLEGDDWVTALVFDELNYTVSICLNGAGQQVACQ
jgi:hypothetical protein